MADYPIKLDRPNMMNSVESPLSGTSETKSYPTLHLEWDEDYELPDSGTMTIKFHKVSETNSKHGGKSRQSVTLDVLSIEEVNDKEVDLDDEDEEDDKESPGDHLDKLAKDAEEED